MTINDAKNLVIAGIIIGMSIATLLFIGSALIREARNRHYHRKHFLTSRPTFVRRF